MADDQEVIEILESEGDRSDEPNFKFDKTKSDSSTSGSDDDDNRSISIPIMIKAKKNADANGVDCNLEEEAQYLEAEYNNTMCRQYTLVAEYGSTSDVDKDLSDSDCSSSQSPKAVTSEKESSPQVERQIGADEECDVIMSDVIKKSPEVINLLESDEHEPANKSPTSEEERKKRKGELTKRLHRKRKTPSPNTTEYEDLESFIKRRKYKKMREREEKKQRKIDYFFKRIKKEKPTVSEATNYDGDDESDVRNHKSVNLQHESKDSLVENYPKEASTNFIDTSNEPSSMVSNVNNGVVNLRSIPDDMDCMTEVTSTSEYSIGADKEVNSKVATNVQSLRKLENGDSGSDCSNTDKTFSLTVSGQTEHGMNTNSRIDENDKNSTLIEMEENSMKNGMGLIAPDNIHETLNDAVDEVQDLCTTHFTQTEVINHVNNRCLIERKLTNPNNNYRNKGERCTNRCQLININ